MGGSHTQKISLPKQVSEGEGTSTFSLALKRCRGEVKPKKCVGGIQKAPSRGRGNFQCPLLLPSLYASRSYFLTLCRLRKLLQPQTAPLNRRCSSNRTRTKIQSKILLLTTRVHALCPRLFPDAVRCGGRLTTESLPPLRSNVRFPFLSFRAHNYSNKCGSSRISKEVLTLC